MTAAVPRCGKRGANLVQSPSSATGLGFSMHSRPVKTPSVLGRPIKKDIEGNEEVAEEEGR